MPPRESRGARAGMAISRSGWRRSSAPTAGTLAAAIASNDAILAAAIAILARRRGARTASGPGQHAAGERHEESAPQCVQARSEEHTSELQSLMRISYAVFCLKKNKKHKQKTNNINPIQNTNKPKTNHTETTQVTRKSPD